MAAPLHAQPNKADIPSQQLIMELGAGFLYVAKETQIDLDSALILASRRNHLNRMLIIGEYDPDFQTDARTDWWAGGNVEEIKKEVLKSIGARRLNLLNLVGAFYAFEPSGRLKDRDSSLRYLLQAKQEAGDNVKSLCHTLCYLGKTYLESGSPGLADSVFAQAIQIAAAAGLKEEQGMALIYWSHYYPLQYNKLEQRIGHLKSALVIFRQINNWHKQILCLTNMGYQSFAIGRLQEAKQDFLAALEIEKQNRFRFTHYTTDLLCFISTITKDHEQELRYSIDVVRTAEDTQDSAALGHFYNRRAGVDFFYSPYLGRTVEWFQKALAEFIRVDGDPAMYYPLKNFVDLLIYENRLNEAQRLVQNIRHKYPPTGPMEKQQLYLSLVLVNMAKKDTNQAERYLEAIEELQKSAEKIRGDLNRFNFYVEIGDYYCQMGRFEKSLNAINKALASHRPDDHYWFQARMHYCLAMIDSVHGQFANAFNHIIQYRRFIDSGWIKGATLKVAEVREMYETDTKNDSIKILNQQTRIKQAELRRSTSIKNAGIAGAALLILFLGYLYYQYRSKQSVNRKLARLVSDKEYLIKEIHHRVKNNLQTVMSLLNTQAKYLTTGEAIAALSESRHRLHAMSLIYQKLYQHENVAFVAMPVYIRELVEYLDSSLGGQNRIRFVLDLDPIELDISQAIPVGLLLNEAVTNSLKYAFQEISQGVIHVKMKKLNSGKTLLEVADNGKGLPGDFDSISVHTMGLRLIRSLVEQMGGIFKFDGLHGCSITAVFEQDLRLKAIAV